jgi:hypothetical protein
LESNTAVSIGITKIRPIQGASSLHKIAFGLYHKDLLIGVITGGRHSRVNSGELLVLDRLCFAYDYSVVGGSSKLFSYLLEWAKNNNYKQIVSYSDSRWSEGNVYDKLGFMCTKIYKSDYSYVKGQQRYPKQQLKLTQDERQLGIPENELRKTQGYRRIWDCGKKRWVYYIN